MERKIGYYMRTSHYLQNVATQIDKIEEGWKIYEDSGISGRIPFNERKSALNPHCAERPNLALKKNIFVKFQTILG